MPLTSFPAAARQLVAASVPLAIGRLRHENETVAVWIKPGESWFEVLTEIEIVSFPELAGIFDSSMNDFEFLAIVGPAADRGQQVLHVMRVAFPSSDRFCFLLEDLIRSGQVSRPEIVEDLALRGLDPLGLLSVESSARVQPLSAAGSAAVAAYRSVLDRVVRDGFCGVVAHQNRAAQRSFGRIGLGTEPILSNRVVHTPDGHGGLDSRYQPRVIPLPLSVREVLSGGEQGLTALSTVDGAWQRIDPGVGRTAS